MLTNVTTGFIDRLRGNDEAAWFELWETFGPVLRSQLTKWGKGRIGAETVHSTHLLIGAGHHLHQAHRPGARGDRTAIEHRPAAALGLHDRTYPGLGQAEPARSLGDEIPPAIERGIGRGDGFGIGRHPPWGGSDHQRAEQQEGHSIHSGASLPMIEAVGTGPK